ncbi:hypothetical protein [Nocardia camponoti]|uniref:Uncharacterized protein n=1 Tax=Nocardia camponoti TaxID=1616106 RepID=A0A917QMH8_9NOCA|nr:hypothetical protein [Nocardia camponoti]GGK57580.1 hypothetical protein GCM10011591_32170 [Nocardia camponoti]
MRDPDVGFTLTDDVVERSTKLSHHLAREVARLGPEGWTKVEASFAMTAAAESTVIVFGDADGRFARVFPTPQILGMLREHRDLSSGFGDGPWWRYLLTMTSDGKLDVDYDYGDEPFPDDQLFPPATYRTDIELYPREHVPMWLAAYIGNAGHQLRDPRTAAEQARADAAAGVTATTCEPGAEFPDLPVITRRWAVIAAAFVAVESSWGPRTAPGCLVFEGASRSGSTLSLLPGDRAVLSGGVWNAPALEAAYAGPAPLPALYRGAPAWVSEVVLNRRATSGLLSFCYWWEAGRWHRGDSPSADQLAAAVPAMWTTDTVVDVVAGVLGDSASAAQLAAIGPLVRAAEQGGVTAELLARVFPGAGFDRDAAYFELTVAGATADFRTELTHD